MRKTIILSFLPCILLLYAFYQNNDNLAGHWVTVGSAKANLDFTSDSFKVIVNGTTENEGTYQLKNGNFSVFDKNCGMQVEGKYKLKFFTRDSVSFSLVVDSCIERSKDINGGVITRIR